MKKIGLLGFGKIGRVLAKFAEENGCEVVFVQDPIVKDEEHFRVIAEADEALYAQTDLVIECATATALKANYDLLIRHCDLLVFSLTSFSDAAFYDHAVEAAKASGHHIYLPHGAILGLDGIFDGRSIISKVSIETTKSPKSLGLADCEKTVVFDGCTRDACQAFPRNVNVHAAVALAGIGFDKTTSRIIADPAVNNNTHVITVDGEGIHFSITVSSFTTGGVTGVYTPLSACGSLERLLGGKDVFSFV